MPEGRNEDGRARCQAAGDDGRSRRGVPRRRGRPRGLLRLQDRPRRGDSASDADLGTPSYTAANTIHATEIGNSFGEPETGSGSTFAHAFDHPGVVITASSGDDLLRLRPPGGGGKIRRRHPAAYPTVVAVGGTSLYLAQTVDADARIRDRMERQRPAGRVPAGASVVPRRERRRLQHALCRARLAEQYVSGYANAACSGKRLVADMAMVGDPLTGYDVYDNRTRAARGARPGGRR